MEYSEAHKRRLLAVKIGKLNKIHLLELDKADFYKNYFDIEQNEREVAGSYCLIMDSNSKVIAFRKDDKYYCVDESFVTSTG